MNVCMWVWVYVCTYPCMHVCMNGGREVYFKVCMYKTNKHSHTYIHVCVRMFCVNVAMLLATTKQAFKESPV